MICENYRKLSHAEKIMLVGEIVHILQSSDKYFNILTKALNDAHKEGVLDRVKILPEGE